MKKIFLALAFTACCSLHGIRDTSLLSPSKQPTHIEFNNSILARVNGKPITLYDVIKKLDMIFYQQFPQYRDILDAKYQYYTINWKHVLNELIDKELVLADAEEVSFSVPTGEIRQEMENLFGPNIVATLDELGLSYDEAWNILKGDLTIRRMVYLRINPAAQRAMTPQAVRKAYETYAVENRLPERWKYRLISFRDSDNSRAAEGANLAHHLLTEENIPLYNLVAELTKRGVQKETVVSVSEQFLQAPKEVSEMNRDLLASLDAGKYSQPVAQKSKATKSTIFRIFYMEEKLPEGAEPLDKVENIIKERIFNEITGKESEAYFNRLHKHFAVQQFVTKEDYQPFVLR